jgi:hypothetical protein
MRAPFEVGEIFRAFGEKYRQAHGAAMPLRQHRAMRAIGACRTAEPGRPRGGVRRLRSCEDFLQFLQEPPLPQMPVSCGLLPNRARKTDRCRSLGAIRPASLPLPKRFSCHSLLNLCSKKTATTTEIMH